jgi:hypothetical protein
MLVFNSKVHMCMNLQTLNATAVVGMEAVPEEEKGKPL